MSANLFLAYMQGMVESGITMPSPEVWAQIRRRAMASYPEGGEEQLLAGRLKAPCLEEKEDIHADPLYRPT